MGLPLAQVVEWWLGGAAAGNRLRPPVAGSHWLSTVCAAKLRVVPGAHTTQLTFKRGCSTFSWPGKAVA